MIVPGLRMLPVVQFGREMNHGGDLIGFGIIVRRSRYLHNIEFSLIFSSK